MANSDIEVTSRAYDLLKNYNGNNGYIIELKNKVYAYQSITLNDFQSQFVIENYDFEPKFIGKNVQIASWWAEKKQKEALEDLRFGMEKFKLFDNEAIFVFNDKELMEKVMKIKCPDLKVTKDNIKLVENLEEFNK